MQQKYADARFRALLAYFQTEVKLYHRFLTRSNNRDDRFLGRKFAQYYNHAYSETVLKIYMDRCKLK